MSLTDYKADTAVVNSVTDELLDFLWRQWAQLGISGDMRFRDYWIIDPEPLLLFTFQIGRFDPRLFDEVLDWCSLNGDWLSIQRLKSLIRRAAVREVNDEAIVSGTPGSDPVLSRTVTAFAAKMVSRGEHRWRTLLETPGLGHDPLPLFRERNGDPLPLFGTEDQQFKEAGLIRSPVHLRGLSQSPTLELPACLILKLRALFGLDPRAESVAYMLTRSTTAGVREIARAAGYGPSTIHTVLTRLAQGRFILGSGQHGYEIDRARWQAFVGAARAAPPVWLDWARVLPMLASGIEILTEKPTVAPSPYLYSSKLLRLDTALRDAVTGSGFPNPFSVPCRLDQVGEELPRRLGHFVSYLNQDTI